MRFLFATRRRAVIGISALIAVLFIAYAGYWYGTAYRLSVRLHAWAEAQRVAGYRLDWDSLHLSGFPGRMRFTLVNATLKRGTPATYELSMPQISTSAQPWDLRYWHYVAPDGARLLVQDYPDAITATGLDGDFALSLGDFDFDIIAHELTAGAASAAELDTHLTVPRVTPPDHRTRGLGATIELWHLVLPKPVKPLGDKIDSFGLALDIMGAIPKGDLRDALTRWRDEGGTVEIQRGTVQWGALSLETNGTLALDKEMQPLAGLSATIVDLDALIDASVAAGLLPAKNAPIVKLVLTLFSKAGPDGRARITTPITVQDQKVYIGKTEIARMPKIEVE